MSNGLFSISLILARNEHPPPWPWERQNAWMNERERVSRKTYGGAARWNGDFFQRLLPCFPCWEGFGFFGGFFLHRVWIIGIKTQGVIHCADYQSQWRTVILASKLKLAWLDLATSIPFIRKRKSERFWQIDPWSLLTDGTGYSFGASPGCWAILSEKAGLSWSSGITQRELQATSPSQKPVSLSSE